MKKRNLQKLKYNFLFWKFLVYLIGPWVLWKLWNWKLAENEDSQKMKIPRIVIEIWKFPESQYSQNNKKILFSDDSQSGGAGGGSSLTGPRVHEG